MSILSRKGMDRLCCFSLGKIEIWQATQCQLPPLKKKKGTNVP